VSAELRQLPRRPDRVRWVELLYTSGCPASAEVHALLRSILLERGIDALLALHEVRTQEEAVELRLLGSPTIRIDGRDVDPAGAACPPGLGRRIYRLPDGRVAGLPSRRQLEDALLSV
jgi:hypothetical protein